MPIKGEYLREILNGNKQYEYRSRPFRRPVDRVIFYGTAPAGMVMAQARVAGTLSGSMREIWKNMENRVQD